MRKGVVEREREVVENENGRGLFVEGLREGCS